MNGSGVQSWNVKDKNVQSPKKRLSLGPSGSDSLTGTGFLRNASALEMERGAREPVAPSVPSGSESMGPGPELVSSLTSWWEHLLLGGSWGVRGGCSFPWICEGSGRAPRLPSGCGC